MITKEEVLDIALLTKDMDSILAFADSINAAGAQAEEYENAEGLSNVFREDEVVPSYPVQEILQNVGGGENGYFPVRKRK